MASPSEGVADLRPPISLRGAAALTLAGITGASGLVYEVAWQKYLAILLGAQSEASAAILALFLGGLSAGYALFGRLAHRVAVAAGARGAPARLLRTYAACEIAIGLFAWAFPWLFHAARAISVLVPGRPIALAFGFDVLLAALLIVPPAVLMGATIPLLTQALSRGLSVATRVHAAIYGLNTLGAFVGALAGGFFLVPLLGLDATLDAMGAVNVASGLGYLALSWGMPGWEQVPSDEPGKTPALVGLAAAAVLLGFAMMTLQTVLLRLGAMAFGASHFTFAMVVATFVLCLAGGSLVVSAFRNVPPIAIAVVPWALVLCVLALHPTLDESGYWVHVVRSWFRNTDAAFYPYQLACAALLVAVLGVPLGLAGATLPLLFHFLRRELGELGRVAGRLYAFNTVGSVLGALLGGYVLLFWLDLHHVYLLASGALVLAAAIVSLRVLPRSRLVWLVGPSVFVIFLLPPWQPERLASGLFRHREPRAGTYAGPEAFFASPENRLDVIHYEDGPVSSVAVVQAGGALERDRSIVVNGKSDGMMLAEYITMTLIGVLPALFADQTENAFVIGWGTGVTAGELGSLDSVRRVDVVEISGEVLAAAPLFDFGNQSASSNPKIQLRRGDAYRELVRSPRRYDIIASEPSNPWVTGVEMLYAREFLETAKQKLSPGGVYAQWIHVYELDSATFELVLRTFASVFPHVSIWYMQDVDFLLLGFDREEQGRDLDRVLERAARPDFARSLERAGVAGAAGLLAHEVLPVGVLNEALEPGPIHTLTHPLLSYRAARAFFRNDFARVPRGLDREARAIGVRNALLGRFLARTGGHPPEAVWSALVEDACRGRSPQCALFFAQWGRLEPGSSERETLLAKHRQERELASGLRAEVLDEMAAFLDGRARGEGPVSAPQALKSSELFARTYHHAIPYPLDGLSELWHRCVDSDAQPEGCDRGRNRVESILGPLP